MAGVPETKGGFLLSGLIIPRVNMPVSAPVSFQRCRLSVSGEFLKPGLFNTLKPT
jgi:hypothetical protein